MTVNPVESFPKGAAVLKAPVSWPVLLILHSEVWARGSHLRKTSLVMTSTVDKIQKPRVRGLSLRLFMLFLYYPVLGPSSATEKGSYDLK